MSQNIKNESLLNGNFLSRSMRSPLLTKDQEQSLTKLWKNNKDPKALEKIILSYSKLVIRIASQFKHYGLPFNDLLQEGHIGLLLALDKFDPSRELRFSTYSRWWVKATIQEYVLKKLVRSKNWFKLCSKITFF